MTIFVYTTQIESLVSHGFIVAAVERTYDTGAVVFPDGRVIRGSDAANRHPEPVKGETEDAFNRKMHAWEEAADNNWAADISFVIDKLTAIKRDGDDEAPFAASLDLSRVGALGHSIGGRIAARACQLDQRIKACAKSPKIDHMSFTDKPLLSSNSGSQEEKEARAGLKMIDIYTRAFFDETLNGQASVLDSAVNNDSVLIQHFSPSKPAK